MDDKQLRNELAVIFRLIRKERPDLARKLRRFMLVSTAVMIGRIPPIGITYIPQGTRAPFTVH